jgi:topoisomerase-4 subunit A
MRKVKKVKNVVDKTAENVEILINLFPSQMAETVVDALYLFTDCEVSYAPNACVIQDEKAVFLTVNELLAYSVVHTTSLFEQTLMLDKKALEEKLIFANLEKMLFKTISAKK